MKKILWTIVILVVVSALVLGIWLMPDGKDGKKVERKPKDISLMYDDRKDICQLLEMEFVTDVAITDEVVTSRKVGETAMDDHVLVYENEVLYATGTGTATLTVDGVFYPVTVKAAPISLIMITGHSIGRGQAGLGDQSVVVEAGQAYSTHRYHTKADVGVTSVIPTGQISEKTGLGYMTPKRITGIDAFAPYQGGVEGVSSAMAWRWNQLTGEKIWIINAAVGGSCLNEWIPGVEGHNTTYKYLYDTSMEAYRKAQTVLKNEIAAGHYTLSHMGLFYFNMGNFSQFPDWNYQLLEEYYDLMWSGFKKDLTTDMDGDGKEETVEFLALAPMRTESIYSYDRASSYYMGATTDFPDVFTATDFLDQFMSSVDLEKFPEITYETQRFPVSKPDSMYCLDKGGTSDNSFFCLKDKVHLSQVTYNAMGISLAENLYSYLYETAQNVTGELHTYQKIKLPETMTLAVGDSVMAIPRVEPLWYNGLTLEVTGDLKLEYPCTVVGVQPGSGTVVLKNGDTVLQTVTITVTE